MHKKLRSTCGFALLLIIAAVAFGQRPRTSPSQDSPDNSTNMPTPPPAPASVKAKYEGGVKTKVRYLTLQYSDPDSNVAGVTSFKLDNKDILDSVLFTLAGKAELSRRGEVFVRKKP